MQITQRPTPVFPTAAWAIPFPGEHCDSPECVFCGPRDKRRLHPGRRRHTSGSVHGRTTRLRRTPRGWIPEARGRAEGAPAARRRGAPGRRASANQRAHRLTTVQSEGAVLGGPEPIILGKRAEADYCCKGRRAARSRFRCSESPRSAARAAQHPRGDGLAGSRSSPCEGKRSGLPRTA